MQNREKPEREADARLLDAIHTGSSEALSELLMAHRDVVHSVVSWPKWHFSEETRKDVEQEALQSLAKSLASATQGHSVRAFVKRVSINRCVDEVRRQVRSRTVFTSMPCHQSDDGTVMEIPLADVTAEDPIDLITRDEQLVELRSKLGQLNETCREAIRKFYLEGMSYKQMAEESGLTVNTIGSRLSKCLSRLRTMVFAT